MSDELDTSDIIRETLAIARECSQMIDRLRFERFIAFTMTKGQEFDVGVMDRYRDKRLNDYQELSHDFGDGPSGEC